MGGAGTSGKGARGPAAPADFGEATEKETIDIIIIKRTKLCKTCGGSGYVGFYLPELEMTDLTNCNAMSNTQGKQIERRITMTAKYSTKAIEKKLEQERSERIATFKAELMDVCFKRLREDIHERRYNQLIDSYVGLFHQFSDKADYILAIDGSFPAAKRQYYLAALTASQFFRLVRARFPSQMRSGAGPYNFKKNNFNFSKDAILANDWELALSVTGDDTIEGLLLMGDYEKAKRTLPRDSTDIGDEILQCMWGIAYQDQPVFDKALKERIKILRRQGSRCSTILDSRGLALIQLALRRGMTCNLNVIELPWELLDDEPADKAGLSLPFEDELQEIIQKREMHRL